MKLLIKHIYLTFLSSIILVGCTTNYMDFHSSIEPAEGEFNYGLYFDAVGIGDPGYYILRLEKDIIPEDVYVEWTPQNGVNKEQNKWVKDRTVLFNYAEAGFHTSDPKLNLIENRFVVFSRGGYYYSLYDIKIKKDTFNIGSPWNDFREKSGYSSEKFDREKEEFAYTEWIKQNVHKEIENYIKNEITHANTVYSK